MTRLPAPYGSRIDRGRPVRFSFEGRDVEGFVGDCIASALAANGRWILSRSFKYHRPRGLLSMEAAEANTLVQVPGEPNVAADRMPIREGLRVTAQNVSGTLHRDRGAVMDRLGRFLPVGFYYRSFFGPRRSSWLTIWEPLFRRKAGLGVVDPATAPRHFGQSTQHCDVLVVGAGAAGMSAAVAAAETGADVVLCDENPETGGALTYAREGAAMLADLRARAAALPGLTIMTGTLCNGWYADNWLPLIQGDTLRRMRAREVIFATGTIAQPAVFRNNDLPGILLGRAVQRLIRHYGVRPARRAVVLATDDEGYDVALDLLDAGVEVAAIVDPTQGRTTAMQAQLRARGVEIVAGLVEEAAGTRGNRHLRRVRVGTRWIDCDGLAVCVGAAPAWQLPCQAGSRLGYEEATARFTLGELAAGLAIAGSLAGHDGLEAVAADGRRAAAAALGRLGRAVADVPASENRDRPAGFALPLAAHPKGRDFVDFDEDLQVKDLHDAISEGYRELELVKRFSTLGMGPSQGRHSAPAAARIVAQATGRRVDEIGVTTARPPVGPEMLGVLAGAHAPVERRTALHARHLDLGAAMVPVGAWWRPAFYGPKADLARLVREEIFAVRNAVGLFDVSTLGKLELRGPDAGAFLDRLSTMAHGSQPVGRVRYCLMLNEMGSVVDDGVAFRIAPDRYYVTATTGAVARVYADMLFWNAQWRLDVDVLNLTGAFSALNLTGPLAREVLRSLEGDIDLGTEAFRYLEGREGTIAGVPVRVMRIGFTGEISYELHCPSSYAAALWDALMAAGAPLGLRPYGLEASRVLRLEKGHIIIGQDTDALTTPAQLGFEWAVSKKKAFFMGKRSIEMRARLGETRRLVGLRFAEGAAIPGESCLVMRDGSPVGHVTSIAFSPHLGCFVALAYVHAEDAEPGRIVTVKCRDGTLVSVPVVPHVFFDPDNRRQEL